MIERTPIKRTEPSLEQKITACLGDEKAMSDDVEALTRIVETELSLAMRKVEQEKAIALNPHLDAEEALHACKLAELHAEEFRNSLRMLEQKHRQTLEQEYETRWLDRQQTAGVKRDAASERFSRLEALISEILATFVEAMQADALVNEANSDAPAGEKRRLLRTEEHCRGLEDGFTRSNPSIMKETVLVGFDGQQVWPIKERIDPAVYGIVDGRRFAGDASGDWWLRGQQMQRQADEVRKRWSNNNN